MTSGRDVSDRDRWARFRFSVIAPLLAAPPSKGELRAELERLAQKTYRHPTTCAPVTFGFSSLERWYYAAREATDPVGTLRGRVRKDAGDHPSVSLPLRAAIRAQHRQFPSFRYQLHYDNLKVLVADHPELGPLPSYAVVRRFMKSQGLYRQKRRRVRHTPGARIAEERLARREVRSFEVEFVGQLFHADFHSASREVLTPEGRWVTPQLLAVLDDKCRLCCHAQWYLAETAENFVHGLLQALLKRGLPRALMSDNGGAETAAEVEAGLEAVGIAHELTLPYSAYQNAKMEVFWAPVEARLLAMFSRVPDLTLDLLNEATQAWYELQYNRSVHSEIGTTPLSSFLSEKNVLRESPDPEALRRAFRIRDTRRQRRSDGTLVVEGVRFEVPNRFRHVQRLPVRYARWNLSSVDLADERTGALLATIYPLNKVKNADAKRRRLDPVGSPQSPATSGQMAPLIKKLLAEYAALGVPPAYIPKSEEPR